MLFRLPIPPSQWALYGHRRNGKGLFKTQKYVAWLKDADAWYLVQRLQQREPVRGKAKVEIRLPKIRGDVSNRIKAIEDWMVKRGLTDDDRHNIEVTAKIDAGLEMQECWIEVKEA
jgi:Holliday junction resolvase RusA-like endonuclease